MRTNTAAAENPSISQTNRASIEATLSVPSTRSRGPPHEASSASSLTERVARTFRFAVGLEGPTADPQQKITVETFLRDFATQHPEVYLPASASVSYGSGAQYDVTESSAEWTLARGAMARLLAIHLVQCKPDPPATLLEASRNRHTGRIPKLIPRAGKPAKSVLLTTHIPIQPSSLPAAHTYRSSCRGTNASSGS